MLLCFINNSFNDENINVMGAAILPNLLRLSMLTKPDVTSMVSRTVCACVNCYHALLYPEILFEPYIFLLLWF